ncbi:activating transcription factor 7-interacting protein 1 [Boleophthalmus pectinirostris]|uniref:activating transcription factor 7-interacting protein 1 n=1 Tax=Boleophthalmus pectinirostris TaxID=150288 RepID=UPI0024308712|nr:activating transcription factor 7-interacting protein 1 [Boleophthalmus pectinirostris]
MNGTHKEDGQNLEDNQESVSPNATSPLSPAPGLSLSLSLSPSSSESLKAMEELPGSPASPFHSLNSELKKLEGNESGPSSPALKSDVVSGKESEQTQVDHTEPVADNEAVENETTDDQANSNSVKDSERPLPQSPVVPADCPEPMETDNSSPKAVNSVITETETDKKTEKTPPPLSNEVDSSPAPACKSDATVTEKEAETKKVREETTPVAEMKKDICSEKMDIKTEEKSEKDTIKQARPSSTPPSNGGKDEKSSSGIKRTLSEGFEPNGPCINREVKRPKVESEEFEAQLELKITAKAGNHLKLEKIVQKLVEEKLRVLEMTIFDRNLQELKDRVDQIDCTTKHHTAMNTLQAKIARLAKKFGEANQASENKKKQEALAAAAAAAAAATAAATAAANTTPAPPAPAAKTVPGPQTQRPARSSMEVKQTTTLAVASTSIPAPATTAPAISAPVPTTTTLVSQTPILQLIASTANAVSNLTASSTTQSPTSTLVLKNGMMATGQPLLIQLPLSMANGQAGTLVNIPVSSLNAVTSLNKSKTTAPTTTFILKSAPTSTSVPSALTAATLPATLPAIQAPVSHVPTSQISLARAVYQGGAGGITTPNSGVSVTSVRAPTQSVSVAGAMSSTSSLVTSGPAATGSTAPGPPQGTSLTTKTDNQVPGPSPSKVAPAAPRPKGSVIDLTEEDDDVLVTGVKSATVTTANGIRSQTSITSTARSSPQTNPTSASTPQLSTHHRPLLDSKSRNTTSTPTRGSSVALPPLPTAPVPPRLPPEAEKTSVPQQPQLKLVPSQTGIVLSWCVAETDLTCAPVDSYHLYAFHQDNSSSNPSQQHWKKIGEVKALPLPMACTLTQFQTGSTYHFAVRAKDIYGRFGAFCEPQCTNVINSSSS